MVAKGNVDKHRQSYSGGVKAVEESKWGRDKAVERYGALKQPDMRAPDACYPQKLGDPNNLQAPGYNNDHREDWVRGFGKNGVESAEGKPNLHPGSKGKK